jgi:hypothetical protein
MDKTLASILMIICLVLGAVGYAAVVPEKIDTQYIPKTCPIVETPEPIVITNTVTSAVPYLDKAIEDFMEYVNDEEIFECSGYEYNFNEISISRVYDNWNLALEDDEHTVNFKIKLEYDEDDERSCRELFEVEVYYKEDEDAEVTVD